MGPFTVRRVHPVPSCVHHQVAMFVRTFWASCDMGGLLLGLMESTREASDRSVHSKARSFVDLVASDRSVRPLFGSLPLFACS